jgi:Flp pilus assembly secretin CpaC
MVGGGRGVELLGECPMLKLTALFASALAVLQFALAERTSKNDAPVPEIRVVRDDANARLLMLGLSEAMAIDVPGDIRKILVGDLQTVSVVVRTLRRVYLVGASVGWTNIVFYNDENRQILALEISVLPQIPPPGLGVPEQLT